MLLWLMTSALRVGGYKKIILCLCFSHRPVGILSFLVYQIKGFPELYSRGTNGSDGNMEREWRRKGKTNKGEKVGAKDDMENKQRKQNTINRKKSTLETKYGKK